MRPPVRVCREAVRRERGVGLVELLVAVALGLGISLMALSLLVSGRESYLHLNDAALVRDAGQIAVDLVSRSVRQAGWTDLSARASATATASSSAREGEPGGPDAAAVPAVFGYDAATLATRSAESVPAVTSGNRFNASDVLIVHFGGSGPAGRGDGSMINCAGFGVGAREADPAGFDAGWSAFSIGPGSDGVPALRCHYRGTRAGGAGAWQSEAVVPGVEDFQVLYGVDEDNDGLPDRYLNANGVRARAPASAQASAAPGRPVRRDAWHDVVSIRFALVVRGEMPIESPGAQGPAPPLDLFGRAYSTAHANDDPGVQFRAPAAAATGPARRLYGATIFLRNRSDSDGTST